MVCHRCRYGMDTFILTRPSDHVIVQLYDWHLLDCWWVLLPTYVCLFTWRAVWLFLNTSSVPLWTFHRIIKTLNLKKRRQIDFWASEFLSLILTKWRSNLMWSVVLKDWEIMFASQHESSQRLNASHWPIRWGQRCMLVITSKKNWSFLSSKWIFSKNKFSWLWMRPSLVLCIEGSFWRLHTLEGFTFLQVIETWPKVRYEATASHNEWTLDYCLTVNFESTHIQQLTLFSI